MKIIISKLLFTLAITYHLIPRRYKASVVIKTNKRKKYGRMMGTREFRKNSFLIALCQLFINETKQNEWFIFARSKQKRNLVAILIWIIRRIFSRRCVFCFNFVWNLRVKSSWRVEKKATTTKIFIVFVLTNKIRVKSLF